MGTFSKDIQALLHSMIFSSSNGISHSCPTSFQDTSPDKLTNTQDNEGETTDTQPHEENTYAILHISAIGLGTDVTGLEGILTISHSAQNLDPLMSNPNRSATTSLSHFPSLLSMSPPRYIPPLFSPVV